VARAEGRGDELRRPWLGTRAGMPQPPPGKRPRTDASGTPPRVTDVDKLQIENAQALRSLWSRWGVRSVRLRAASEATDLGLYEQARHAADRDDLLVHTERNGRQCSAHWDDNRTWDPGD